MSAYIVHLPDTSDIILSGQAVQRLIAAGDGDAALLYIVILKNRGTVEEEKYCSELKWSPDRFRRAMNALSGQKLIALPDVPELPDPPLPPRDSRPEYTRADMARALEGKEFAGLTDAVEARLGKKLTTPDMAILLGLYDQLGLPTDLIYLLVSFCCERVARRYGKGRQPTMRQIEKEGYAWARLGLMDQESASAYIRKYNQSQDALPRIMRLLGLDDRKPSPSEEKYLLSWIDMGFEDKAIELAYDKTVLKCKELKWPYMNKILCSWNGKGLHTLAEIEKEDKQPVQSKKSEEEAIQEDMARMEKYRQQLIRKMEEES